MSRISATIALQIASSHMGQSPQVLVLGISSMIQQGIDEMLALTQERMMDLVNKNQLTGDLRQLSSESWQTTNDIADQLATKHFSGSPGALIKGMAELVDKGICQARELAQAGLAQMVEHDLIPASISDIDLHQALLTGYMLQHVDANGQLGYVEGKPMLFLGDELFEWNETFKSYWSVTGSPRVLMAKDCSHITDKED